MTAKIPIIGVGPDGLEGLTARSREWLTAAEVVFGSDAVLRLLPELKAERVRIGADLPEVVEKLRAGLGQKPGLDLGHLEHGRDRLADAHEATAGFEEGHEIAQGAEGQS